MSENRRPSTTAGTGNIQCPYFIAHGKTEIICEGVIEGVNCRMDFKCQEKKTWHQQNYCEREYKRCEQYCSVNHWLWPDD